MHSMMLFYFVIFVFIGNFCKLSFCFAPSEGSVINSWNHENITRAGIYKAVAEYMKIKRMIKDTGQPDTESVSDFFGSDSDGLENFNEIINKIIRANNAIQRDKRITAKISFNAEDIDGGHQHLVNLRLRINKEARKDKLDIDMIREWIGHYLYTLQSFYSNTNWVELKGAAAYQDLGNDGIDLMEFAAAKEYPCKNADFNFDKIEQGSCKDNLNVANNKDNSNVANKLTSGYRSGQDKAKPQSTEKNYGKCSHGGKFDRSRTITATCGINKETSRHEFSPHFHLHTEAATAAVLATELLLTQKDTGLMYTFDQTVFLEVFGISKKVAKTLAFAIDVSGSMGGEIAGVIKETTDKVSSTINSNLEAVNYVLATFNDPDLTTGYVTYDAYQMIKQLKGLSVSGGGDCPEYALSGISKAISLSLNGSTVFSFTDASPKDNYRYREVAKQAIDKDIKLVFAVTGNCSSRKRREVQNEFKIKSEENGLRHKKQALDINGTVFEYLASLTGGRVVETTTTQLPSVLEELISESFPSAEVTIKVMNLPSTSDDTLEFYVDEYIFLLHIIIDGAKTVNEVKVTFSNGTSIDFTSGNNTARVSESKRLDITIQAPSSGLWKIIRNIKRDWIVNITGQSTFDFTYKFMEQAEDEYMYEYTGNPISGKNYTVVISALKVNGSLTSLSLVDLNGTELSSFDLEDSSSSYETRYSTVVAIQPKKFLMKIYGNDASGNVMTRVNLHPVYPVDTSLYLIPIYDELVVHQLKNVSYRLSNLGEINETYTVTIIDNRGFVFPPRTKHHPMEPQSTIEDSFVLKADSDTGTMLYTVNVRKFGTQDILQTESKRLYVTSIQHPECFVNFTEGSCPTADISPKNCFNFKWFAITETVYSNIGLSSILLSVNDSNTQLSISNISDSEGTLQVNISGDCCLDSVNLNILDTDGYLGRCSLNFRVYNGIPTKIPVIEETTTNIPVQHPDCLIVQTKGLCPKVDISTDDCRDSKWFAVTETSYSRIALTSVSLSVTDPSLQLFVGNISATKGPLRVNVSGNCCFKSVFLEILDADGFLGRCDLDFRDRNQTQVPISPPDIKLVAGVTAGVIAAVVLIITAVFIFVKCYGKSDSFKPSVALGKLKSKLHTDKHDKYQENKVDGLEEKTTVTTNETSEMHQEETTTKEESKTE